MFGRAGSVSDGHRCPSLTLPAGQKHLYTTTATGLSLTLYTFCIIMAVGDRSPYLLLCRIGRPFTHLANNPASNRGIWRLKEQSGQG